MRLTRRTTMSLALVIAVLLGSGAAALYLRQGPSPLSVDAAVAEFRRSQATAAGPGGGDDAVASSAPVDAAAEVAAAPASPGPAAGPEPQPPTGASRSGPAATGAVSGAVAESATGPAASLAAATPVPAEGVYVYATEGYEWTSALGGSRHDYPQETSVVLRHSACGFGTRWQPLKERWDESAFCHTADALEIRSLSMYHEFFQRGQRLDYECQPGSIVFSPSAAQGTTWAWRCQAAGAAVDMKTTVVGNERMAVGGADREVVRVRYEAALSGSTRGTQVQERWIDRETGLIVRLTTDVTAATQSPFGWVDYEEHYTIDLTSLTPRT